MHRYTIGGESSDTAPSSHFHHLHLGHGHPVGSDEANRASQAWRRLSQAARDPAEPTTLRLHTSLYAVSMAATRRASFVRSGEFRETLTHSTLSPSSQEVGEISQMSQSSSGQVSFSTSSAGRMSNPLALSSEFLIRPVIKSVALKRKYDSSRSYFEEGPEGWFWKTKTEEPPPLISHCMLAFSVILFILTFPWCLFFCVKVAKEYQRVVVFRLGRLIKGGTRGPGLFFVFPCIDTCKVVDLRVLSFDVPAQEILSRDSVTVSVEAVIYFRVSNPVISVTNVNDAQFSTRLLAQTTLRNVLGTKTLSEMLSERDSIASITEKVLDEGTDPWGVKVERVEIKDIRLPHQLMKSMAAEAEAARDARARVIAADGERDASRCLKDAADTICSNRVSMQLRYLQTLRRVAADRNHTVIVPFPVEVARHFLKKCGHKLS
ncbi:unnamed protein product, partial [Mesorhabditis belari]|uniref:Band 7 domain-containing protein n=1 Tax=Mesorhabditis belari TaxID=2138241 RepID=A0AAF3FCV8_9BILA